MRIFVKHGLHMVVILVICLSLIALSSQLVYANGDADKAAAIQAAKDAVDALPEFPEISNEHRPAVEEARRLADIAMTEYGATRFELCLRIVLLEMIEEKLEKFVPDDDVMPLPPTGGTSALPLLGIMITGAGLFLARTGKKN